MAVQLDRSVPFVDAVLRVIDGTAPLGAAVDALARAELESGIVIVGEPITSWIDGRVATLSAEQPAMTVLEFARCAIEQRSLEDVFAGAPALDEIYEGGALFPLLDRTHLMLAGYDFCNDYAFILHGRTIASSGTFRVWGGVVAAWASRRGVAPSVDYLTFYMRDYLRGVIGGYDQWADTVLAVLQAKNRQLSELVGIATEAGWCTVRE